MIDRIIVDLRIYRGQACIKDPRYFYETEQNTSVRAAQWLTRNL